MRTFQSLVNNQKGQTIVESLVGLGLISVIGLAFSGGMVALRNATKTSVVMSSTERQINDIAENIKAGVENYQVNYNFDTAGTTTNLDKALDYQNLPMAWDNEITTSRDNCPKCAGTYGYIIQPLEAYRGLFQVTLRLTHKDWAAHGEKYRDYTFVVSAK